MGQPVEPIWLGPMKCACGCTGPAVLGPGSPGAGKGPRSSARSTRTHRNEAGRARPKGITGTRDWASTAQPRCTRVCARRSRASHSAKCRSELTGRRSVAHMVPTPRRDGCDYTQSFRREDRCRQDLYTFGGGARGHKLALGAAWVRARAIARPLRRRARGLELLLGRGRGGAIGHT